MIKNMICLAGRSLAERIVSILMTCVVTILAFYLFDEAWTDYRVQMKTVTQNADVMGEDPYRVLQVRGTTSDMMEFDMYETIDQWMEELREEGRVKTAGAYFSYNYEFKELKNIPGLKEELDQFWLENYGYDPAEMNTGEDGWFAGLVIEDGFQDLVNLRLSESLDRMEEREDLYPIYFGSAWKAYVDLGQILTSDQFYHDRNVQFQVAGFLQEGIYAADPNSSINSEPFCMDYRVVGLIPEGSETMNEGLNNYIVLWDKEDSQEITDWVRGKMRETGILGSVENWGEQRENMRNQDGDYFKTRFQFAVFAVSIAFIFASVVFVSNLFSRKREIGVFYACGFGERAVFGMVLTEHVITVLGAFVMAYGIRVIQIRMRFNEMMSYVFIERRQVTEAVHMEVLPGMLLLALLFLVLASLIPYGLLRRMDPVTLLEEGTR